jgi:hypothetical protein
VAPGFFASLDLIAFIPDISSNAREGKFARWLAQLNRFQLHKRRELLIRTHNETLPVAAMRVSNPD